MTFTIIGTGNMAWFLGTRLRQAGITCTGIYGRNAGDSKALASALDTQPYKGLAFLPDHPEETCILAVNDSAIGEIAAQLHFKKTTLLHTSGTVPISVLSGASEVTAVLWPVYSILKNNLPAHRDIPCAWQASSEKAKTTILQIAAAISDIAFETNDIQRSWLHLAAVFGNNFINHLMAITEQICTEQGLSFEYLQPILQQTFQRSLLQSPSALQTGPARRNDDNTINKHIALLSNHTDWQALYDILTVSIQNFYKPKA